MKARRFESMAFLSLLSTKASTVLKNSLAFFVVDKNIMELNQAKQIISEAMNVAIKSGCFNLLDVQQIVKALEKINEMPDIQFDQVETNSID